MGCLDADVEAVNSITYFLTLPSIMPQVSKKHQDSIFDFTKSIMHVSDKMEEYINTTTNLKVAKIDSTKDKK